MQDLTPHYFVTGFDGRIPVGEGLLTFRTLGEAVTAVERVRSDYEAHYAAARALAEMHFDSDRVLVRLLEEAGVR